MASNGVKYDIQTLSNGLRIVLAPMPGTETATVLVMTGTGSRYENEKENGLAHFLEHMFFKGTKKRSNAKAISEELDGVGSEYNAFTAKERTAYHAKVSSKYLDTALDCVLDIFLNSKLPQEEINKERGAIIQEINMYEDMPIRTINDVFEGLLFGRDAALGRTILGPKANILSFSRQDFTTYLKRNYTPANTVVCVAGSFSNPKVLAKIKKEFAHLTSGTLPAHQHFAFNQTAPRIEIKEKKTDQTQLMLGVPAYPYLHKDEYALEVLSAILGSGMSSRLFLEVREKRGLAYFVRGRTDKYPDVGYFVVQAGVEHKNLEKTVLTILDEFKKIKRAAVSPKELAKAKAHLKGGLALELETSDAIAENAATSLINLGKIRSIDELRKGIDKVTSADVQRIAENIFKTESLNLAIIGPHLHKGELLKLLHV